VIAAIVAVAIYMLTDGRFLFIPLLFVPALPLFRRSSQQAPAPPEDRSRIGAPRLTDANASELPPPPSDRGGTRADPRWN